MATKRAKQAEKWFTFKVTEAASYEVSTQGRTAVEAARKAGKLFSENPNSFLTSVDDRDVFLADSDSFKKDPRDFIEEFEKGMGET